MMNRVLILAIRQKKNSAAGTRHAKENTQAFSSDTTTIPATRSQIGPTIPNREPCHRRDAVQAVSHQRRDTCNHIDLR